MENHESILVGPDDRILVTGAAGFIGSHVVKNLVDRGFRNVACFARPSSDLARLESMARAQPRPVRIDILKGNLLSRADCEAASKGAAVIFQLAAGTGQKSFPDTFMNSVVMPIASRRSSKRSCSPSMARALVCRTS